MDEPEQFQQLPETPQKTQIDLLPEKLKNSLYVHHITDDNITAYALLISHLPKDSGIIRPASNGEDLSYITIKKGFFPIPKLPVHVQISETAKHYFNNCTDKRLLTVISNERKKMTAIFFNDDTPFSSLKNLSLQKKVVLNLIQAIDTPDEILEDTQLGLLKQKINVKNLLNNLFFYKNYIQKNDPNDPIVFSEIISITLLQNNIYLLKMEDNNMALISKSQLIAAKNYKLRPQKHVLFGEGTIFHTSHKQLSRKRKAEDVEDDDSNHPAKKAKYIEQENLLKDSPTKCQSSAGQDPEQQNPNSTKSNGYF